MGLGSFIKKAVGAVAPAIGAATGNPILGAIGTGIGGALSAEDSQDFAVASAQQANEFTREQLQNRHQWEVADLRSAGLNPILSALKGAPSIGGSAVASSNASAGDIAANLTNSASQSRQIRLNEQKLESEIDLIKANATAAKTQGTKNLAEAANTGNISNITQNLGNLAQGFHGFTSNSATTIDKKLKEIERLPDIIREQLKNPKKPEPSTPFLKWLYR